MIRHYCDMAVVTCIDFRFQKYIRDWLDKNHSEKTFDYIGYAGSTKDLQTIIKQVDISVKLHHIKQVILIHHENCGAYGDQSTPQRHREDLLKAKFNISKKYPQLSVKPYYLKLSGEFTEVN